jgi:hypothetical protein
MNWTLGTTASIDLFGQAAANIQTPGRVNLKRPPVVGNAAVAPIPADGNFNVSVLDDLFPDPEEIQEATEDMIPRWGETMARNWSRIKDNFLVMGNMIEDGKEASLYNFDIVEKEFATISRQIAHLDTRIGVNTASAGEASVWEALDRLLQEGRKLQHEVGSLAERQGDWVQVQEVEQEDKARDQLKLDTLGASFNNLAASYRGNIRDIDQRLSQLDQKVAMGSRRGGDRQQPNYIGSGVSRTDLEIALGVIKAEVETLAKRLEPFNDRSGCGGED